MEWTNDLCLEFIGLYEKYPVLWNPKYPGHKNRNILNDAWSNIAKEISIDVTVEVLRKKKESLMATYRTLAKKVRESVTTGSGTKDIYVPSWFAYDAIDRFIRATGKKIPSLSSEETLSEELIADETSSQDKLDQTYELQELRDQQGQSESNGDRQGTIQDKNEKGRSTNVTQRRDGIKQRKVTTQAVEAHITKHLKQASDALTTLTTRSEAQPLQDASALYGQLLATKLRRLTPKTQLILQNKIDNLVFQAELSEVANFNATIERSGTTTNFMSPTYVSSTPTLSPSNSYNSTIIDYVSPSESANPPQDTQFSHYFTSARHILDINENNM